MPVKLRILKPVTAFVSLWRATLLHETNKINIMNDLGKFVGLFVRHGNDLGMIDAVHGERLGFVWSDKASWTSKLVDVEDVTICESDEDCSAALDSALQYFRRESDSIINRIALGLKQDDQKTLNLMLINCKTWLYKLS